jgi:adenosylcobinamide-GDP ribazoletransferase
LPILLSTLLGWKAVCLNAGFVVIIALILYYYKRRLGCITGDMLGAITEITESGLFLVVSLGGI